MAEEYKTMDNDDNHSTIQDRCRKSDIEQRDCQDPQRIGANRSTIL